MPRPKGSKNKPKTVKATVDFAAQIGAEKVILRQFKSVPPIDGRREAAGKIRFHVFSFLFMFASLSLRHFL